MAFDTFVHPAGAAFKFAPGSSENHAPRVLTANFGDGYQQRAGDGLNADLLELSVSWEVLTPAEGEAVASFFASKKGYIPFKFTLPGQASPRKFICPKWTRNFATGTTVDISATWKEVNDPE